MDIAQIAATRHTAKAFDPARKIPDDLLAKIRALLRNSPSSVNSQPWHFVIAGSADAKARLARAMPAPYAYNAAKVQNASHAVVFCVRTVLDDAHLEAVLAAEIAAGRLPTPDAIANQRKSRLFYADLHRQVRRGQPLQCLSRTEARAGEAVGVFPVKRFAQGPLGDRIWILELGVEGVEQLHALASDVGLAEGGAADVIGQ